jgi:hypothetical protein
VAPCACDASSTTARPCSFATASSSVIRLGIPHRWTTTIAFVRGVTFARTSAGSSPPRAGSLSAKTGTAPSHIIGTTDAHHVADGTITSSPGSSPSAKNAASSAAVPLQWARAWRTPK